VAHNDNENELDAKLRDKVADVKARRALEVPPAWFVEPLMDLAMSIAENTAQRPTFSVRVASELGLCLGLAPGEEMKVHTATGYVTVVSERT
jgi:hypothetical protein